MVLLPIDQVITPKTIKCIDGEGIKHYDRRDPLDENLVKGDLFVTFDIVFPKKVS